MGVDQKDSFFAKNGRFATNLRRFGRLSDRGRGRAHEVWRGVATSEGGRATGVGWEGRRVMPGVRYKADVAFEDGRIVVRLGGGVLFSFPIAGNRRLEEATPEQRLEERIDE